MCLKVHFRHIALRQIATHPSFQLTILEDGNEKAKAEVEEEVGEKEEKRMITKNRRRKENDLRLSVAKPYIHKMHY